MNMNVTSTMPREGEVAKESTQRNNIANQTPLLNTVSGPPAFLMWITPFLLTCLDQYKKSCVIHRIPTAKYKHKPLSSISSHPLPSLPITRT